MGDETTVLTGPEARHLLRRTGFGARPKDVFVYEGLTRGEAADRLLLPKPKGFKPSGGDIESARAKWLKYMIKTKDPLQEKLVLFWHDHFATGYAKVLHVKRMAAQNRTIRLNAKGDMRVLVKAMNRDAAMIEWLDTVRNRKEIPNENYARELQELFTLGVTDLRGNPTYTQGDIVQIARAFTGWRYDYDTSLVYFEAGEHDFNEAFSGSRGRKRLYGQAVAYGTGTLGGFAAPQPFDAPEGESEIDQVTDAIFAHRDSDGRNTVARRTTKRLLEFFCHGGWANPSSAQIQVIDDLVTTAAFDVTFDVRALLRALFTHDAFYETQPAPFASPPPPKSVRWPVDFVVTTMRLVAQKGAGRFQTIEAGSYDTLDRHLTNMGQTLLDPPSVFGWSWETAWISSATLLARYRFARDLVTVEDGGARFKPEKIIDLTLTAAPAIVDAVLVAMDVVDQVSPTERNALIAYLGGPGAVLDLFDDDTRNRKLRGLFALVIQSPVYQTH